MILLIVDDNPAMRRLIGRVVANPGVAIHECGDGAGALAEFEKHRPDWVLMDVEMKEKDGLAATREIVSSFPDARVVIVTRHDDDQTRAAARAAGARAYVVKEDLIGLREIIGIAAGRREMETF